MRVSFAAPLLAVVLGSSPVAVTTAQIGGLVKKAAGKVVQQAADKAGDKATVKKIDLKPDTFGEPFTAATLEATLKGLQATLDEKATITTRSKEVDKERADLLKKADGLERSEDITRLNDAQEKYSECEHQARESADAAAQQRVAGLDAQLMVDPAKREQLKAKMDALQKAQASGDTSALRRATEDLEKSLGVPDKTAAVRKACGEPPKEPAWMAEQRTLRARAESLSVQLREYDKELTTVGARASGMDAQQYARQRERLATWRALSAGSRIVTFNDTERALLDANHDRIEVVKKAL
jgi:hypothetical protein